MSSQLGGLFFLVNLGLYLELYGDFSTPLTPGIALPIWDFVAIVGEALLREHELADDPVWALLAQLAGRESLELRQATTSTHPTYCACRSNT